MDNKVIGIKKQKFKKRIALLSIIAIIVIILTIFLYRQNNDIVLSKYTYSSEKVTKELNGYTIVQISDLHTKTFGKDNSELINMVEECKPDMIAITGDYIDSDKYNDTIVLAKKLVEIAPTYYVTGNHEVSMSSSIYSSFEDEMKNIGVLILSNSYQKINDDLYVIGLDNKELVWGEDAIKSDINDIISNSPIPQNAVKILLAHEPQYIDCYAETSVDMVLSGHAHGGQIRIPFSNISMYAPGQGLFPKYTSGEHVADDTTMYISRGLGNSVLPFRIFNKPELVKINLVSK